MDKWINKIHHGDCLELMKDISDNSIDMILCDLPYGVTQCKWDIIIPFDELWKQYLRIVKDTTPIVLFGAEPFSSQLRLSNLKMYKYDWIWEKSHATGFLNAYKQPLRTYENICVFYKKQCVYNPEIKDKEKHKIRLSKKHKGVVSDNYGKYEKGVVKLPLDKTMPKNIIKFSRQTKKDNIHPTQKPVALYKYLIKTYTNEGMLVLDNCIGSGTTAIACEELNRRWIGIEKEKKYVDLANERLKNYRQQLRLF